MEKILVSDIRENQKVDSTFLVKGKSQAVGKTGKPYIYLKLSDKTGEIKGYVWDNVEKFAGSFEAGDIVKVKSKTSVFQNELQLGITDIEKVSLDDNDAEMLSMFLKSARRGANEMFSELVSVLNENLSDEYIIKLADKFLKDENYVKMLKSMPAAKSIHHAYIGGLLEHTLGMLKIGVFLAGHYGGYVVKDVLLASILLHDAGKMEELCVKNNVTEYSDEGRLLGHIVLGAGAIDRKIAEIPGFPEKLRLLLLHSIISHHGELEYGSPKRPKTAEAFLLHYIDNMDARINQLADFIGGGGAQWSQYSKSLDRYLLNSVAFAASDDTGETDAPHRHPAENGGHAGAGDDRGKPEPASEAEAAGRKNGGKPDSGKNNGAETAGNTGSSLFSGEFFD